MNHHGRLDLLEKVITLSASSPTSLSTGAEEPTIARLGTISMNCSTNYVPLPHVHGGAVGVDANYLQSTVGMCTGPESSTTDGEMDNAWQQKFLETEQGSASFCCPLARRRSTEDAWRDLL